MRYPFGAHTKMSDNYALQDDFLAAFFKSRFASEFYLTGGTALARFYFHHRTSVDLDLFTNNQSIDFNEVNLTVTSLLRPLKLSPIKQVTTETFLQYIQNNKSGTTLKVDMVKDIPVHFGTNITNKSIRIDSLENIGSNKILAIFGRTDAKDFVDLYYILHKTDFLFDNLFNQAKQKDLGLTEFYLANSIANVSTITLWPPMKEAIDTKEIVKYYLNLSKKLLMRIKPKV